MAIETKNAVLYRFNDRLSVSQEPLNFVVRRGAGFGTPSYFSRLSDAFEDVYEDRVKDALSKKQCTDLLEVITRVKEANEEMKKFIIDNVK